MSYIPAGEPVFVIRGQDPDGAAAVRLWAALKAASGTPAAVIEQALQQADALAAWPHKKPTDADHLSEDERLQLEYQLTRRDYHAALAWTDAVRRAGPAVAALRKAALHEHADAVAALIGAAG